MAQVSAQRSAATAGRVGAVVGFLIFVELTSGIIQGYYLPLVGKIAEQAGVTDADITWFVTVQTLVAAVCVPLLSKLGDIFGHRRMLRIVVILVALGAGLSAFASTFELILVGRALMGPLAVWLPLEIALIHSRLEQSSSRKAIGLLISALTFGALLGGIMSGIFSSVLPSLTATLIVPFVASLICVIVVFTRVPESTVRTTPKIDWPGFIGLAVFMLALLAGLRLGQGIGFDSLAAIALLALAAISLVLWVLWELRAAVPAVDLRIVAQRTLWPAYVTSFFFGIVVFGSQTVATTFLAADPAENGYGFGLEPGQIAIFAVSATIASVVGAAMFARLSRAMGIKGVLILANALAAVSNIVVIVGHAVFPVYFAGSFLGGLGMGLLLGALPAMIAERSPADQTGIATGLYNTVKTLGGAIAGAIFSVVLAAFYVPSTGASSIEGYYTVWGICVSVFLLSVLVLMFTPAVAAAPTRQTADVQ